MEPPRVEALPPVPTEVTAFAVSQGAAADDVLMVLKLTRRLFPTAPLSLRLKPDSDLDDSHIVVEVEARGYDDTRIALGQTEWTDELFKHCPSTQVCLFRLVLV